MATKTRRKPSEAQIEAKKAETDALLASIADKVATMAQGDEYINYLRFTQSFHTYSFNNQMLMWIARLRQGRSMPTLVAGFGQWADKGYLVREGEGGANAMRIFAFSKRVKRDKDGNPVRDEDGKIEYFVRFPVVSVFNIDQVEPNTDPNRMRRKGKTMVPVPLAQPLDDHMPELLTGDDVLGITDKVAAFVADYGWSFHLEPVDGEANGFTMLDGSKRVVVDSALEPAQQAKTALHEAAHMLMHATKDGQRDADGPQDRAVRELEAESVAFVAGRLLGLDTEQYSDKYLLHWGSRADEDNPGEAIRATAERVREAVKTLVAALGGGSGEDTGEAEDVVVPAA